MEYVGLKPETLGNIKKTYFSVFDRKLRLLDIYRQKQTKTLIYIHIIYKQTQTCKKIIKKIIIIKTIATVSSLIGKVILKWYADVCFSWAW